MPFTPFHFGPGLLLKGALLPWFSFTAYVASQVLIDLESLYYLVRNEYPVHRVLHTFLGATVAGFVAAALVIGGAKYIRWITASGPPSKELEAAAICSEVSTVGALLGGLLGAATHVLLDSIMHRDARPLLPWSDANPFLGMIPFGPLHEGCVLSGIVGLVLFGPWLYFSRRA